MGICAAVVDEGRGRWAHVWTKVGHIWLTRVGWGGGECMCTAVVDEVGAGGHTCGLDVVIEGRRQVGLCVPQWFKVRGRWVHVCCSG